MNNQEAIALLRNLEDSLDSYCELNEEGKTAFRTAIEALSCSEIPNNSDTISRQQAIDFVGSMNMCDEISNEAYKKLTSYLDELPSVQPEPHEIGYSECANAMLKMWIDNVLTDGEYNRIMDKLNAHWAERREK